MANGRHLNSLCVFTEMVSISSVVGHSPDTLFARTWEERLFIRPEGIPQLCGVEATRDEALTDKTQFCRTPRERTKQRKVWGLGPLATGTYLFIY